MPAPDLALVCKKEETSQGMQSFALVDLRSNAPLDLLGEQIAQNEDRFVQATVFLKGTCQHVFAEIAGEVLVDVGAAPFDFDKKNELNYFVRTITPQGEQRIYWGKDLPRALEEAGAKVGDSITATRVASKPVTVEEIQEQPDGSKQTVRPSVLSACRAPLPSRTAKCAKSDAEAFK